MKKFIQPHRTDNDQYVQCATCQKIRFDTPLDDHRHCFVSLEEIGKNSLFEYLVKLYIEATEKADLSSWELLPDKIGVGHLTMKPGTYEVSVKIKNGRGNLVETLHLPDIKIKAGEKCFIP